MITKPWGKCQNKTLKEQYDAGVRYFDVRVKIINDKWHLVHNNVDYGRITYYDLGDMFISIKATQCCYIRLILDIRKTPKNANEIENRFKLFVQRVKARLADSNFNLDSVIVYWKWKEYKLPNIEVKEYHASVSAKWYQYIFGTKLFAKRHNKYARQTYYDYAEDNERVLLLDYI